MRRAPTLILTLVTTLTTSAGAAGELFLDPMFSAAVETDISYATGSTESGDLELHLDLYRPEGDGVPALLPALVWVHGGGWELGDKAGSGFFDDQAMARFFATRGYVTVSISYRLARDRPTTEPFFATAGLESDLLGLSSRGIIWSPGHFTAEPDGPGNLANLLRTVAASAEDTASAVAWLRAHAGELGVDRDRIIVGGLSAGATASLLMAYSGHFGAESGVSGVLSVCGSLYDNHEFIDAGEAPLVAAHGESDAIVPYHWGDDLRGRATAVDVPLRFLPVPGTGHCPKNDQVVDGSSLSRHYLSFFHEHLRLDQIASPATFVRGDSNTDGAVDVSDVLTTLNHLFLEATPLTCHDAADTNDDGAVDISDPVAALAYLFLGNLEIPAPGPSSCGEDSTPDELGCTGYDAGCAVP